MNAPRAPGFDGRVAGREINSEMGQQFALDFLQQLGSGYGQQQGQRGGQMTAAGTNDPRFTHGGMTSSLGPQNAIGGAMKPSASMQGMNHGCAARRCGSSASPRDCGVFPYASDGGRLAWGHRHRKCRAEQSAPRLSQEPQPDRLHVVAKPGPEPDPPDRIRDRIKTVAGQALQLVSSEDRLAHDA